MKKLIYLIVAIVALGLIVPGCIPVVPPTEQSESVTLPNRNPDIYVPADHTTIQGAINAASSGDTIQVAAGTYNEGALVFDKDDITLIGSGADTTTIITSSNNYGVYVQSGVDYITIKNFTIEEDESNNGDVCLPSGTSRFHLKISHNSGFTLENVKLHGPGKEFSCITGLDLHTVQDVTIKNVEITGYSKNGVGVTATTSTLLFENVTIDNNGYTSSTGWAGISFYTMGGGDITDVQFLGTNTISNNPMGVYVENVGGDVIITGTSTTTLSGNSVGPLVTTKIGDLSIVDVYAKDVFNVPVRLENAFATPPNSMIVGYWHDVTSAGTAANNPFADGNPVIFNLTNGEWYVVAGINMNIQAAIDAASDGDTINVAAGTYSETFVVDKQLTLQGAGSASTIIDASGASADYGILLTAGGTSASERLIIRGLTIKNSPSHGIKAYKGGGLNLEYVTFEDLVLTLNGSRGMEIHNDVIVHDMEITNCEFVSNGAQGLRTASNVVVNGLVIADSKFNGNSYGIYLQGTISGVTILRSEFNNSIGGYGGYMTETGPLTNMVIEDSEFNNNVVGLMVWNEQNNADITITSTLFQNNDRWGVLIWGNTLTDVLIQDSEVLNNDVSGLGYYGIDFNAYDNEMTNVAVHYTNITGHAVGGGVKNRNTVATAIVDATCNWWGDVSGPHDETLDGDGLNQYNPDGLGDHVTEYVLYDPWIGQGGMVTGGGWIISPAGAYTPDPSLSGKATFGFFSKYKKGAVVPDGNTQFNFQVADLNFHSDSYDWLVIAGAKAKYKGTGTINGSGTYGFMLSAIDEKLTSSTDVDKFRIKIWDKSTDTVIYDNKQDGDDGTEIGGGQIVIHKGK